MINEILEIVKIASVGIVALVVRGIIAGVLSYLRSDARVAKLLAKIDTIQSEQSQPVEQIVSTALNEIVSKLEEKLNNEK